VPLAVTTACAVTRSDEALARVLESADLVLLEPSGTCPGGWSDEIARVAARCRDAGKAFGVALEAGSISPAQAGRPLAEALARSAVEAAAVARSASGRVPLLSIGLPADESPVNVVRLATCLLDEAGLDDAPLLLVDRAGGAGRAEAVEPRLETAVRLGGLLADGIGDAVRIEEVDAPTAVSRAFGILQVTRLRMSRPDYIACPSCGRTLFDLEEVTARIKSATSHLKGVKIAIMGCVVNGPGEMADADFGYVGSAPGRINLYVKKDCVEKNLPAEVAGARLIELIKQHGAWVEPPAEGAA
jgi:(E)-4-hydroxy-3-methylbut-2-enyl-diphosphate synthase